MNLVTIIIISCWIIMGSYWTISAFYLKPQAGKPKLMSRSFHKAYIGLALILLLWYNIYNPLAIVLIQRSLFSDIISVLLCIFGAALAVWARIILAGNWGVDVSLKKGHELVQDGPYRLVRHPIYTGLMMLFIGTCISIGRVGGFIGFLILVAGLWIKIRQEESLMTKHFGKKYLDYKKKTKAVIPFIL